MRQKMRAEDGIRLEVLQMFVELIARWAGNRARPFVKPLHKFSVVRLGEKHTPQIRRALNHFDVPLRINLFVERRKKFGKVHAVYCIARSQGAPCLVQRRSRSVMPATGGDRCYEN